MDETFVTNFELVFNDTQTLDSDQEKFKTELKTKTEALQQKVSDLEALHSEAKKIVKIEMEKSLWIEFGIGDKREFNFKMLGGRILLLLICYRTMVKLI